MDLILKKINKLLLENGIEELERKAFIQQLQTELKGKKYGLVWENKVEKVSERLKTHIPYLTEVEEKRLLGSPDDETHHLLIEGDNLEALTLLQTTHKNTIDICYIDPPYNTGNKDFVYNDNIVDKDDTYRDSKWLSFMDKRLRLAYDLLNDDGVIFISIDDNQQAQLKLLCDEIFGDENFIKLFIWEKTQHFGRQTKNAYSNADYILCYAKSLYILNNKKRIKKELLVEYQKNIFEDAPLFNKSNKEKLLRFPKGSVEFKISDGIYSTSKDKKYELNEEVVVKNSVNQNDLLLKFKSRWQQSTIDDHISKNGKFIVKSEKFAIRAIYGDKEPTNESPKQILFSNKTNNFVAKNRFENNVGTNEEGSDLLKNIIHHTTFDYPKPISLISYLISLVFDYKNNMHQNNQIVLDFFAGSGTTGHAVLELNKEDSGNRQFILCTNNENNICEEVTYERLSRVINGYMDCKGKFVKGIAANMDYYKVNTIPKVNNSTDNAVQYLTKGIEIIGIKENAFNREDFKEYSILSNRDKVVLVYLEPFVLGHEVIEISKKLKGYGQSQKIIYSTMTDVTVQGIEVKEYPQEILEQINRIQEILKQWEDETFE